MDSGGGEHTLTHWTLDGPTVLLPAMAAMFDVFAELSVILEDDENPQTMTGPYGAPVTRHLYRTRVTWREASGMEHTEHGWEATGADAWAAITASVGRLSDVREVLRQVYGPRSPRLLGPELEPAGQPEETSWDQQLAAYDERDVSRAKRVEDLAEALKRLAPEHE
jgi:hypothetical protein